MSLLLLLKLLVVLAFLVMFIRRPTIAWGIGLLTVTTAVLLDTILGTFGREQTQEDLGFFFYIITGALFGGGAFWLWSVLRSAWGQTTAVSLLHLFNQACNLVNQVGDAISLVTPVAVSFWQARTALIVCPVSARSARS